MFGIMFEVDLLFASFEISTFMNKPLFIHTSEKLLFMTLYVLLLIQIHAHVIRETLKRWQMTTFLALSLSNVIFTMRIYVEQLLALYHL